MKTAISLPDDLFMRAERVAQKLKLNRSQLYTRALETFLDRHDPETITAAFDAFYGEELSELDPLLWEMQLATLAESGDDGW